MPISPFQKQVLLLLKSSRNPESYVAGGTAIQRAADSLRYSNDIDFFHDTDESLVQAYSQDRQTLTERNYSFTPLITQPSFYRAVISKGKESLKLEWVRDTAFRFFPVIEDPEMGYRMHDIDLAINKCLALANRTEVRDILDILEIDKKILPLSICIWAACGKDPGFTPELILEMIQRHAIISPELLGMESLSRPLDPKDVKSDFLKAHAKAKLEIPKFPTKTLGCLFLDKKGEVIRKLENVEFTKMSCHYGSVRGSWPRIVK